LIDSRDPYLLLHAHNPVDWYPWGPEALAKAKRENKPIFVSIGYSTCYWCHVAERTIYSNREIAKLMNQWFINIKLDREQFPDLDRIYMTATEIMTGQGGWPNNVFLTPDLKPFFAGSYFAPDDFTKILNAIHQAWTADSSRVIAAANSVYSAIQEMQIKATGAGSAPLAPASWMAQAEQDYLRRLDSHYGGFESDGGPKFPQEPEIEMLLADYRLHHDPKVREWLVNTLDAMAYGGVRDQLGEGFHRYSTEPTWSVPHFEKMLYDNAQLLRIYAAAYRETSDRLYRQVAIGIGGYLGREMMAPEGGFFTAQDAQVDGVEGASYIWTREQIETALGKKNAAKFFEAYQLTAMPRPRGGRGSGDPNAGVIRVRLPIANALKSTGSKDAAAMLLELAPVRARLLKVRSLRPQPARDEKILVGLNGLTIEALADTAGILNQPQYLSWARRAAERIWSLAWNPKTGALQHEIFEGRAQTPAYLDDYAMLGDGFMAMYDVTGEQVYEYRAMMLADAMLTRFGRENGSLVSSQDPNLLIPLLDSGDDVYSSGTSAAVELLLRLGAATKSSRYTSAAARVLHQLSGQLHQRAEGWPCAITVANLYSLEAETKLASNSAGANANEGSAESFHIPGSADRVHATAAIQPDNNLDTVEVTLRIDNGYHVNANPASLDYLIPTSVSFDRVSPIRIVYPKPRAYRPSFADRALNVYDGVVIIEAAFSKTSFTKPGTVSGNVTVQACDSRVCLPPATLPVTANLDQH